LTHVVEAMDEDQLRTVTAYGHSSTHDGSQLVRQYLEEIEERKADSQQRLDKDCQQLLSTFPQIKVESVAGHVVERIVQKATDDQVDLVVLAARKLNALQRFFGSTTEGLLVQCPCSLLIVHEQAPV
jgi:nucleotide-binding universal stress UspA family protein